ncbi:hypothetical protein B0H13DRAFT_1866294 [Mycena leptocephala]|nr:hypothetical protein B0H13DRAFT_1866294 [Mycena leptocephala]
MYHLARANEHRGNYLLGQKQAYESWKLAKIAGDLFREVMALKAEMACWTELGRYEHSIFLSKKARDLLALCGMSGSDLDHAIMNSQSEVHKYKSEYVAARHIQSQILHEVTPTEDPGNHALALLSIADIDVLIGASEHDVQSNIDIAKKLFITMGESRLIAHCDMVILALHLRGQNELPAVTSFLKLVRCNWGKNDDIVTYCLEKLASVQCWSSIDPTYTWKILLLIHSLKSQRSLGVYKALQSLGDVFMENDTDTATSLLNVALDGFTQLDVHHSRAECMLQLGDMARGHGDLQKAVKLWETARPLFERSSQTKQVEKIDEKLVGVLNTLK